MAKRKASQVWVKKLDQVRKSRVEFGKTVAALRRMMVAIQPEEWQTAS